MKYLAGFLLASALGVGCAAPDPRPTADDIVCLCKGDLGCVCVRVDQNTPRSEYKGKTYYFCGKGCKIEFDKDPEKWVKLAEKHGK